MKTFYFSIKELEEGTRFKEIAINDVKCCGHLRPAKGGIVPAGFSRHVTGDTRVNRKSVAFGVRPEFGIQFCHLLQA